ncbi:MAG: hypothetical protein ILP02_02885 [Clostridia bacterium]|nr:hypothetical protein [Clostridia bacterium]
MIVYIVLCMPFFIDVKIYSNRSIKKTFFLMTFFFLLKISGYIRLDGATVYFHVSDKKSVAIRLLNTRKMIKGKVGLLRSVEVLSFTAIINLDKEFVSVPVAAAINAVKSAGLAIAKTYKPFMKITEKLTVGRVKNAEALFGARLAINIVGILTIILRLLRKNI